MDNSYTKDVVVDIWIEFLEQMEWIMMKLIKITSEKCTESTINLIGITRGGKSLSKGKIPIHEKLSIGEDLKIPDMKTIGNIKTPGNKAENMTQYIRSVLYGQHQFALPNGMGTINASEDLFKFSKIEDNVSNEAKNN